MTWDKAKTRMTQGEITEGILTGLPLSHERSAKNEKVYVESWPNHHIRF